MPGREARRERLRVLSLVRLRMQESLTRRSLHGGVLAVVGSGSRTRWPRVPGRGARAEMLWALDLVRLRMPAGLTQRSLDSGVLAAAEVGSRTRWYRAPGREARGEMLRMLGLVRLRMPAGLTRAALHVEALTVPGAGLQMLWCLVPGRGARAEMLWVWGRGEMFRVWGPVRMRMPGGWRTRWCSVPGPEARALGPVRTQTGIGSLRRQGLTRPALVEVLQAGRRTVAPPALCRTTPRSGWRQRPRSARVRRRVPCCRAQMCGLPPLQVRGPLMSRVRPCVPRGRRCARPGWMPSGPQARVGRAAAGLDALPVSRRGT
ncbi:hypothetical protein GCM10010276_01400 [Streptomyces longisporus]|uniref:Uncharacterized protein n=1 Tax=Streptomyces longisporus TaxID=1948 RepID=A0ABN3KVH2_STRLO